MIPESFDQNRTKYSAIKISWFCYDTSYLLS